MILELKDLEVYAEGKRIVTGLELNIGEGEVHAIMGPNGSGKSTVCNGIMGHPKYKTKGSIKFCGEEISKLSPDQRAKRGIFLAFQNPQQIQGVNVVNVLRKSAGGEGAERIERMVKINENVIKSTKEFGIPEEFAKRDLNVGFSGGEKKRMELLQMKIIQPKLAILDEVESGLDVDGIKTAANAIRDMQDGKRAFLIITHFPRILKYVKPDFVHVMLDGKIVKSGKYKLAEEIEKKGYDQFKKGT